VHFSQGIEKSDLLIPPYVTITVKPQIFNKGIAPSYESRKGIFLFIPNGIGFVSFELA
jgi:hypothetical protein